MADDKRTEIPSPSAANFELRVRETLMTYLGRQGNPLDRGLTVRDLLNAGLITWSAGGGIGPAPDGGGTDPGTGGEYVPDYTPPPTPTGFKVSAGITFFIVEHDAPLYPQGHGHLRTRLYGITREAEAPLPVFADAIELAQFTGTVYAHPSNPATTWHLWIKWETNDGILSIDPAGGTNGVVARTGEDVRLLLEVLTGAITGSQLYADLGSRIALIDGGIDVAGSVNARIAPVAAIASIKNRTYYQATAPTDDLVAGDLWFDTDDDMKPSRWNGAVWEAVEDGRVTQLVTDIQDETSQRIDGDLAEARRRAALYAASYAGIGNSYRYFVQQAEPTGDLSIGDIWTWEDGANVTFKRYNGLAWVDSASNQRPAKYHGLLGSPPTAPDIVVGDIYLNTTDLKVYVYTGRVAPNNWIERIISSPELAALVAREEIARVDADGAYAEQLTTVAALAYGNAAMIEVERTARATADEAAASQITTLAAAVDDSSAAIQAEALARATADTAIASNVTTLQARILARPNILPNAGFEDGKAAWNGTQLASFAVESGVWGRTLVSSSIASGSDTVYSDFFPVAGDQWYTIHGDATLVATSGTVYFDLLFYNAGGAQVADGGQNPKAASFDFSADDANRASMAVEHQAPSTATKARARFGWSSLSGCTALGCRLLKVERGRLPYSTYTAEASLQEAAFVRAGATSYGQYTVKIDLAGHVSGFGLAAEIPVNDAPLSQFGIRANRFFVAPPSFSSATAPVSNLYPGYVWVDTSVVPNITRYYTGSVWSTTPTALPFIVQMTQTEINGVQVAAGVYMDTAFIRDGTITNAKIGNAVIDDAKVANLSAAKLTAGDGTIGNVLKSSNYVASVSGWRIDSTGNAQFNNIDLRGSLAVGAFAQSTNYVPGVSGWKIAADGTAEFGATSIRGQLTASQIDTRNLTIKDAAGNILFGAGTKLNLKDATNQFEYEPHLIWDFTDASLGWASSNISSLVYTGNSVIATPSNGDPILTSPTISISGARYNKVRARVRRNGGSSWDGSCLYATGGHGMSASYYKNISDTTVLNQWTILEWDMEALTAGGSDWTSNTITQIRLDLGASTADVFEFDWVTIGRYGPFLINTANISTFIANAAIGTAQIGNAAITTAQIGEAAITFAKIGTAEIGTLKVAGGAITESTSAYSAGGGQGSTNSAKPQIYVPSEAVIGGVYPKIIFNVTLAGYSLGPNLGVGVCRVYAKRPNASVTGPHITFNVYSSISDPGNGDYTQATWSLDTTSASWTLTPDAVGWWELYIDWTYTSTQIVAMPEHVITAEMSKR